MIYNIFHKDNKITWATTNEVTAQIISDQANNGVGHFTKDIDGDLMIDAYYINSDEDDIVAWSNFSPTIVEEVDMGSTINWTGIPQNTIVYLNDTNVGTVPSDGTITFTGTKPGRYTIKLSLTGYKDYINTIEVIRTT